MVSVAAVIPAAGRGKRLGADTPKAFFKVLGKPLLIHTLSSLMRAARFTQIIISVHPKEIVFTQTLLKNHKISGVQVVAGGKTRAESVHNAVKTMDARVGWVLVHDAARPLASGRVIRDVIKTACQADGAVAAIPISSTIKKIEYGSLRIVGTADRSCLFLAQTPQVFRLSALTERYRYLGDKISKATDEAALFDGTRARILAASGDVKNIKITTQEDVELMKYYLRKKGVVRGK